MSQQDCVSVLDSQTSTDSSHLKKRRRSLAHDFFVLDDSKLHYTCKGCGKKYKALSQGTTTSLKRHILSCQANTIHAGKSVREPWTYESFREFVLTWIVDEDLPHSFSESKYLKTVMAHFGIAPPCRKTIRSDSSTRFSQMRLQLKSRLSAVSSKISFTVDCWTSANGFAFMGVTAHWIDQCWSYNHILLDFIPLEHEHTGSYLASCFVEVLHDFDVVDKALAVVSDNASNMIAMMKAVADSSPELQSIAHVRCFAHILHLAVKAVLGDIKGNHPVTRLRRIVNHVRITAQRRHLFTLCLLPGQTRMTLIPDVETRWNSTDAMIERALILRPAIETYCKSDDSVPSLSAADWDELTKLHELLQVFKSASDHVASQKYPTLSAVLPLHHYLMSSLEKFEAGPDDEIRCAAARARAKLTGYFPMDFGSLFIASAVLDVRFGLRSFPSSASSKIADAVTQLYDQVYAADDDSKTVEKQPEKRHASVVVSFYEQMRRASAQKVHPLQLLFMEPALSIEADVLSWWSMKERQTPGLARMAKDYLAIPATSCPIERVFSGGSTLLTKRRCAMKKDHIRRAMCLKSWIGVTLDGQQSDEDSE